MQRNDGNRSFRRAAVILDALARAQEHSGAPLSLTRLTEETGLAKSTVHRLLRALQDVGLVSGDGDGQYVLGRGLVRLGRLARGAHRDLDAIGDALARLAALTGDTSFYTERSGTIAVCLMREDGNGPFRNNVLAVGDRHPLGIGGGSLAILAALPPAEAARITEENLRAYGDDTEAGAILRSERYARALHEARSTGRAVNPGLVVDESWAVGVAVPPPGRTSASEGAEPVPDDEREAWGALSVASIRSRLQEPRLSQITAALRKEAAALAERARSAS